MEPNYEDAIIDDDVSETFEDSDTEEDEVEDPIEDDPEVPEDEYSYEESTDETDTETETESETEVRNDVKKGSVKASIRESRTVKKQKRTIISKTSQPRIRVSGEATSRRTETHTTTFFDDFIISDQTSVSTLEFLKNLKNFYDKYQIL
jgi:hypothetical protein